jgi:hypothetical protein
MYLIVDLPDGGEESKLSVGILILLFFLERKSEYTKSSLLAKDHNIPVEEAKLRLTGSIGQS